MASPTPSPAPPAWAGSTALFASPSEASAGFWRIAMTTVDAMKIRHSAQGISPTGERLAGGRSGSRSDLTRSRSDRAGPLRAAPPDAGSWLGWAEGSLKDHLLAASAAPLPGRARAAEAVFDRAATF